MKRTANTARHLWYHIVCRMVPLKWKVGVMVASSGQLFTRHILNFFLKLFKQIPKFKWQNVHDLEAVPSGTGLPVTESRLLRYFFVIGQFHSSSYSLVLRLNTVTKNPKDTFIVVIGHSDLKK